MKRLRSSSGDGYPDEEISIDIIPLVDVVFLLLTFFIFLTLSMVLQEGITVDLAGAETGTSTQEQNPLVISLDQDSQLYLGDEAVSREYLRKQLKKTEGDRIIQLNADGSAPHRDVIGVLDIVRRSGLDKVTFTVEPAE